MWRLWVQLDAGRPSECTLHPSPADPSLPPPADPSHLLCLPPSPGLRQAIPPTRREEGCQQTHGGVRDSVCRPPARLLCLNPLPPPPLPASPFPKPAHNPPYLFLVPTHPYGPSVPAASRETHMAGVASSGARIRVPSFSRWQNSSLICTPGYGEAPDGRTGWELGGEQATAVQLRSDPPLPQPLVTGSSPCCPPPLGRVLCLVKRMVTPACENCREHQGFHRHIGGNTSHLGPSGSVELC